MRLLRRGGLLPAAGVRMAGLPEEVTRRLPEGFAREATAAASQARAENLLRLGLVARVGEALGSAGIPVVLLKGIALVTAVLPDPGARDLADLDILARPGDREAIRAAIASCGLEAGRRGSEEDSFHRREGTGPPLGIEVHYHPFHGALRFGLDVERIFGRSRTSGALPPAIRLACPEDLFLHLAVHSVVRQKERALALRALFDLRAVALSPGFSAEAVLLRARETGLLAPLRPRLVDLAGWFPDLPISRAGIPWEEPGLRGRLGAFVHAREVARALESPEAEDPEGRIGRPVLEFFWAPRWGEALQAVGRGVDAPERVIAARGNPRGAPALALRYASLFLRLLLPPRRARTAHAK